MLEEPAVAVPAACHLLAAAGGCLSIERRREVRVDPRVEGVRFV
jgi:hypothetical protein